jgi:hypothetical protein
MLSENNNNNNNNIIKKKIRVGVGRLLHDPLPRATILVATSRTTPIPSVGCMSVHSKTSAMAHTDKYNLAVCTILIITYKKCSEEFEFRSNSIL